MAWCLHCWRINPEECPHCSIEIARQENARYEIRRPYEEFAHLAFGSCEPYQVKLIHEYLDSKTHSSSLQRHMAENASEYVKEFKDCLANVPKVGWSEAIRQRNIQW